MKNIFYTFLLLSALMLGLSGFISQNPLLISIEKVEATADNNSDGSAKIKISGGTPPYTLFLMSPDGSTKEFKGADVELKNLTTGQYGVVVRDRVKKQAIQQFQISVK